MTAHPLARCSRFVQNTRLRVDLDQRAVRLLDAALHHHHAADLPGTVHPVKNPELALAVLAGITADLAEGHPGHVPSRTMLTLPSARAPQKPACPGNRSTTLLSRAAIISQPASTRTPSEVNACIYAAAARRLHLQWLASFSKSLPCQCSRSRRGSPPHRPPDQPRHVHQVPDRRTGSMVQWLTC